MTAELIALKEAVERGDAMPEMFDAAWPFSASRDDCRHTAARVAYHGGMDGALSLLASVLPDAVWTIWRRREDGLFGCNLQGQDTEFAGTPSRAMLLAILSALIDAGSAGETGGEAVRNE